MQNVTNCATVEYPRVDFEVLLQDGGFCNGCITKRCLHISTNVSYNVLFLNSSMIIENSNKIK